MMIDPTLVELVTQVIGRARRVGLDVEDQRDAAVAVLWAAMPSEAPAVGSLIVQQLFPRLAA